MENVAMSNAGRPRPAVERLGRQDSRDHGTGLEPKSKVPQQCTVVGCTGKGRFSFHGRFACSRECLELLLRMAVLEEQTEATAAGLRQSARVQLGRILIEQGTITEQQLDRALRAQRATGAGRLGCWLKQQIELPEADFTAALSIQWRCPVFRIGTFASLRMAQYLPRPLIEAHGALPLRVTGAPSRLSLCFEDHLDSELLSAVERMHGIAFETGLLTATDFWEVTRQLLSGPFPPVVTVSASSQEGMTEAMSRVLVDCEATDSRMVAVHGCYWLRFWTGRESETGETASYDILCTPTVQLRRRYSEGEDDCEPLVEAMLAVHRGGRTQV